MNKNYTLRSENRYALKREMQATIQDEQVVLAIEGGGIFRIDNTEDAKKLRDMLDMWIAYQEL